MSDVVSFVPVGGGPVFSGRSSGGLGLLVLLLFAGAVVLFYLSRLTTPKPKPAPSGWDLGV